MDSESLKKKAYQLYQKGDIEAAAQILEELEKVPKTPETNTHAYPLVLDTIVRDEKIVEIDQLNDDEHEELDEKKDYQDKKIMGMDLPPEVEQTMLKLLKLDEDLYQLRQLKSALEKEQKKVKSDLIGFMDHWQISEIGPDETTSVKYEVKEVKQGYSKRFIEQSMSKIFNPAQCQYIFEQLEKERKITEQKVVKVKKPKQKK